MTGVSILEPGKVSLAGIDCDKSNLGKGMVKVRLLQGGLCGSDLSAYLGTSPMVVYPRVIGHELVGTVIEAGNGGEAWLGKTIVVEPMLPCGQCYPCRQGRYNCCTALRVMGVHVDGGLQEEFIVPASNLHEVPTGMDLDTAVLAEPLTISAHALERAEVKAGEKVLIFGAGAIGLLALQAAASYIGADVFVVDVRDDRLGLAKKLGANATFNVSSHAGTGTSPELVKAVKEWSGGDGAHVAIEASGHPASNAAAIDCLAHSGRIALVGWNKGPISVDTVQLMRKEATIYGSRNSCRTFGKALEILAGGHISVNDIITHKLPLEKAEDGLKIMKDTNQHFLKVVLTVNHG